MRDNDVKKINYFVRILPRDSLYIIEAVELITQKVLYCQRIRVSLVEIRPVSYTHLTLPTT